MFNAVNKKENKQKRHWRLRKRLEGTLERPRLSVTRTNKNLSIQLVDDIAQKTLLACSTQKQDFRKGCPKGGNVDAAKKLGQSAAQLLKEKGFDKIVFDRGGCLYHGRIKALADSLRENGIKF